VRRSFVALGLLLLVAIAVVRGAHIYSKPQEPVARPRPSLPVAAVASRSDRIEVSPAELKEAYAAGIVDRPVRSILNVPSQMHYGDFVWNDNDVPAGPLWIRVDLKNQILSVFRSGDEIGTAVILYGADGVPTPTGKFRILAKFRDHRSATYDGAPMPYTLRLTDDGVSIHGSNVRWGFATHGCIGIPKAFAAKLFEAAALGDPVTIVPAGADKPRNA
jgi:lipoprotein-anchoring transpeptidase ErfK/SrfK